MSASLWLWRHVTSSPGFTPAVLLRTLRVRNDPKLRARHSSPHLGKPCQNASFGLRMPKLCALRQGWSLGVHIHLERDRLRPFGCTCMTFRGKHFVDDVKAVSFARSKQSAAGSAIHKFAPVCPGSGRWAKRRRGSRQGRERPETRK